MTKNNPVLSLYQIKYPLIQAGMVWVSGGKLAGACAQAGILGVIGAGSMKPDVLTHHLEKALHLAQGGSLAVNIPLLYSGAKEQIDLALQHGIKHFITSAGSPKLFTGYLKDQGVTVTHVVSSPELAVKCEQAGVDAIIAEGFEAGGHNGRDELTTLVLIPQVVDSVKIPVIAAGGIMDGRGIKAVFALGASGAQMGTRFLATQESSAHPNFKQAIVSAKFNDSLLLMKKHIPVRLLKNLFAQQVKALEDKGGGQEDLVNLLGKGRAKLGMLEGELNQGELEVGQGIGMITDLPTVHELVTRLVLEAKW